LKIDKFIKTLLKYIATAGFIGYIPFAPGTFGSLLGLILFIIFKPSITAHILIIIFGTIIGIYASTTAEKIFNEKDSGRIVIDELIGFFVSVFYLPHTPGFIFAAFFLFRFFDILKPFPIANLERGLDKGTGIMADDLLAGVYANIILQIWVLTFR